MNIHATLRHSFKHHAIGLALLGAGLVAHAACSDARIYLSQSVGTSDPTDLQVGPSTLPVAFATAGTGSTRYNALGYNPSDDKLYAISAGVTLLEINEATGADTNLGAITGLPTNLSYNSGAFSSTGKYYVKPGGNNAQLYEIDVTTRTATLITLSQAFTTSDMAWVGSLMYTTADNGQLYSIDVATGATTAIGSPDATGGVLGAQFSGTNGLFGSANNGSGMYRVNLTTGKRDKLSDAPAASNNDGASCPTVALFDPLPPDPGAATPVPALDEAGLGLLSLLGAGAGALALRRRKRGQ